ncbi:MAG: DarT ssDNA thymidine ADP-ribosyltransferase family protein [Pseudomonadota bacterium]
MVATVAELIAAIKNGYRTRSLFHFTDEANLKSIRQHGLLSKAELDARGIVPVNPGGDDASRQSDTKEGIYDDVRLSLVRKHSMAYICKRDERQTDQIVFSVDPVVMSLPNVRMSLGMANSSANPKIPLQDAVGFVDVDVMYTNHGRDWSEIRDTVKRNQKYEVLIPKVVEPRFLLGFWRM